MFTPTHTTPPSLSTFASPSTSLHFWYCSHYHHARLSPFWSLTRPDGVAVRFSNRPRILDVATRRSLSPPLEYSRASADRTSPVFWLENCTKWLRRLLGCGFFQVSMKHHRFHSLNAASAHFSSSSKSCSQAAFLTITIALSAGQNGKADEESVSSGRQLGICLSFVAIIRYQRMRRDPGVEERLRNGRTIRHLIQVRGSIRNVKQYFSDAATDLANSATSASNQDMVR